MKYLSGHCIASHDRCTEQFVRRLSHLDSERQTRFDGTNRVVEQRML